MTLLHDHILPKGTQIGVNEIKDALRIGKFDITYRAWNHHLKERVEIQEYFPHNLAIRTSDGCGVEFKSPSDKESFEYGLKVFLNQADILTQIEHPNIATAENILQLNGTAYLIKNYQEGLSLSKLVQSPTTFGETEIKFILASILNALQKIHEYKIVHGSIQPKTIWLNKNGEPVLVDFAAARLAIAARTGELAGELVAGYASMEQYECTNEPGPATDFYALGATMYFCMTQNQPVNAQTRITALNMGEPDPLVPLSEYPEAQYSAELLQAIDWMLQPQYADRPQSATEILALLKSEQAEDRAMQTTAVEPFKDTAKGLPVTRKQIWVSAMVGMAALIVVGLWFVENPSDNETVIASKTTGDQSIALTTAKLNEESGSVKISGSTDDEQPENELNAEGMSSPTTLVVTKPELTDVVAIEPESDIGQQLIAVDEDLIKKHLNAAEKAMRADRLLTPSKTVPINTTK